jgi:hypothetical protein
MRTSVTRPAIQRRGWDGILRPTRTHGGPMGSGIEVEYQKSKTGANHAVSSVT